MSLPSLYESFSYIPVLHVWMILIITLSWKTTIMRMNIPSSLQYNLFVNLCNSVINSPTEKDVKFGIILLISTTSLRYELTWIPSSYNEHWFGSIWLLACSTSIHQFMLQMPVTFGVLVWSGHACWFWWNCLSVLQLLPTQKSQPGQGRFVGEKWPDH